MKQRIFFVILCVVLVVFAAYAAVVESGWTRTSNPGIARTNLATHNANNITINTISDARLSANVSLLGQSITEAEIDISNLPDTELLINQAGSIDTIPQTTFVTPAQATNIVQANGGGYSFIETNATAANSAKTTNNFTFEGDLEIDGDLTVTGIGLVTPRVWTDRVDATNASTLEFTAAGQTLVLGSGGLTLSGAGAGYIGPGPNLTFTGSGNNGNLATSVNTLQELNDAVDNLSLGSGAGGSSNSSYTNITVYTADNDPDASTGPALTLRPLESRTTPGGVAVLIEQVPPYNSADFGGKFRHVFYTATNTFGDLRPDVINSFGYNFGGNAAGVGSFGPTDTNEPALLSQRESRWQNGAGLSQSEFWELMATPYTDYGTNFGFRWFSANLVWDTTSRIYVSSDGNINLGTFDFINPRGNALQGVRIQGANSTSRSMNQQVWGTITVHTNDVGLGAFIASGGTVNIGSSPAIGESVIHRLDWQNSAFGLGTNHFFVYPNVGGKIYNIGSQIQGENFMQINHRTNTTVMGKFNVTGTLGIYGLIASGAATNATGSRVAYLSDVGAGNGGSTVKTNFVLNTIYTNNSGAVQLYSGLISQTTAGVNGNSGISVLVSTDEGATFVATGGDSIGTTIGVTLTQTYTNTYVVAVGPTNQVYLTNISAGVGNSALLVAGSGQLTTVGAGTSSSGSGSNGVSYVNYPAVRTIADDVVQVLATNGVAIFSYTNSTGIAAINTSDGSLAFRSELGGPTVIDSGGIQATEIKEQGRKSFVSGDGNRLIYAANGTTISAEFADATAPIFGGITLDLDAIAAGQTLVRSGTSIIGSNQPVQFIMACSDETTTITTGTAKATFRAPYAFTVTAVRLSLTTASSSGLPTIDINETGTTILSTKLTCDASEKTSTTAATPAVISDTAIADDAELTFDFDVAGTGATGVKVTILGYR